MPWGIEHPDVIDLVTENDEEGVVRLIVTGPDKWVGSANEQRLLEAKVAAYLEVVNSGTLYEYYPDARLRRVMIQLDLQETPPESTQRTIDRLIEHAGAEHGISLRVFDLNLNDYV